MEVNCVSLGSAWVGLLSYENSIGVNGSKSFFIGIKFQNKYWKKQKNREVQNNKINPILRDENDLTETSKDFLSLFNKI